MDDRGRTYATFGAVGLVVLAQVGYPLVSGPGRDAVTIAVVCLGAMAAVLHAALTRGVRAAIAMLAVTAGGGFVVETVGTATGLPFGGYDYTGSLGPMLLDVPLVVPLAWTMMAWPAWLVAGLLVRGPVRVLIGGWALASWDVFLDPQMVDAGHWTWTDPAPALPGVPAVPLTNYAGWLLVSVLMMAALSVVARRRPALETDAAMTAFYLWTYGSSVLAHLLFLGLAPSGLWGAVFMGPVAVALVVALVRRRRRPSVPVAGLASRVAG